MPRDDSFTQLMARLRAGDQEAAARVFHQYAGRLVALARSRLGTALRGKVDPEDAVQSAFKSFFLRQADGQFHLKDWDSLWGLLAQITIRKCGRRLEYFQAACRDVQREVAPRPAADDSAPRYEALAREPGPEEAAVVNEIVESLLRQLHGRDQQILGLSLEGCTVAEVSAAVGCTERTVYRVREFIKARLLALRDGSEDKP